VNVAAIVISISALLFTVGSFWWLQARTGRLETAPPRSYAGVFTALSVRLRLPLVLYNTGPVPIVLDDMRLIVGRSQSLKWITLRSTLKPTSDDVLDFTSALVIAGRSTVHTFIEFGAEKPSWLPEAKEQARFRLEGLQRHADWTTLVEFDLVMPSAETMGSYIAHEGADHDC
jgi:hypothetical protein